MKIIINESQLGKLQKVILKYIDDKFSPKDGWDKISEYINDGKNVVEIDTSDYVTYYYYTCDGVAELAPGASIKCPLINISSSDREKFDNMYGNIWRQIFIKWFQQNSGHSIRHVT